MPPVTLALVEETDADFLQTARFEGAIAENISRSVVLDGMQRLNTLKLASEDENFDPNRLLHVNFIIAPDEDRLLYRMITLNNGQKPMTARHQIEILTHSIFDFEVYENFEVQTEKESENKRKNKAFKLADISKSYTAFLTKNVNNENNKIIDEKMDEILVSRIISQDMDEASTTYQHALRLLDKLCVSERSLSWFKVNNNLIGFMSAVKVSFAILSEFSPADFEAAISKFDEAFKIIKVSKVNLGKFRRVLAQEYIANIDVLDRLDLGGLEAHFAEFTA